MVMYMALISLLIVFALIISENRSISTENEQGTSRVELTLIHETLTPTGSISQMKAKTTPTAPSHEFNYELPISPDAWVISKQCVSEVPGNCLYSLRTKASVAEALDYYKRTLLDSGWHIKDEDKTNFGSGLELVWVNTTNSAPMRRFLLLSVERVPANEDTSISLSYRNWPDPARVPLYPDAQSVEMSWDASKGGWCIDPEQVTTYVSNASTTEIIGYYKDLLVQHGWEMSSIQPPEGVSFGYHGGGVVISSRVLVKAGSIDNGRTRVELRAEGFEGSTDCLKSEDR